MFTKEVYSKRRKELKALVNNGLGIFLGNVDSPMNYLDNIFHFRQDSTFLYLFGIDQPGMAAIIDFDSGEEMLFGNDIEIDDIIWMGEQPTIQERGKQVGISDTHAFSKFAEHIKNALKQNRKIHFLPPYRGENKLLLSELLNITPSAINEQKSLELIKAVIKLRSIKDEFEIAEIEKACATGYDMHVTAMRMAVSGEKEQNIAGMIEGIPLQKGGHYSFPIILSQDGQTLHNHLHTGTLTEGRLMLTDAGAETAMHYASDFTRTTPVNGKFTQKQKEIYQIVLDANNSVTNLIKPNVTYKELHLHAATIIAQGLKDLGLMKGDVQEAVKAGAHALFFPHGLGHMMGLDVHDMEDLGQIYVGYDDETRPSEQFGTAYLRLGRKLENGFVITNEPGIYFIPALIDLWQSKKTNKDFINFEKVNQYRDFGGIRLEDDILVTENGNRLLGKRIPISIEEVENTVGK